MALYRAVILAYWSGWGKKQDVALPLVIALPMVMVHIFVEHISQGVFTEDLTFAVKGNQELP
jgi:hypothetical protein